MSKYIYLGKSNIITNHTYTVLNANENENSAHIKTSDGEFIVHHNKVIDVETGDVFVPANYNTLNEILSNRQPLYSNAEILYLYVRRDSLFTNNIEIICELGITRSKWACNMVVQRVRFKNEHILWMFNNNKFFLFNYSNTINAIKRVLSNAIC